MRTTIAIEDHLLKQAKNTARRRGVSLGRFVEEAIQRELGRGRVSSRRPPIPVFNGGTGPRPGFDVTSNRGLLEALDEGRTIGQLR